MGDTAFLVMHGDWILKAEMIVMGDEKLELAVCVHCGEQTLLIAQSAQFEVGLDEPIRAQYLSGNCSKCGKPQSQTNVIEETRRVIAELKKKEDLTPKEERFLRNVDSYGIEEGKGHRE
jgi:hypothetical protein